MTLAPDKVLEARDVSKRFARSAAATRKRLARTFFAALRGRVPEEGPLAPGEFWALRDVSFDLRRGEALGVIGLNGSGKSTLLKLLGGLLLPDAGEVSVRGRIGELIDLGGGFQPHFSGRENVFVKGALLGRSRREMREVHDKILEFAELGEFIDAPVRTYSAGMKLRLGFAVAVHIEPDLLLVDEILAVGDFRFKQKCQTKIAELRERCSIVLVTHSMSDLTLFCDRAVVLDRGRIAFHGEPGEAVRYYLREIERREETKAAARPCWGELFHNPERIGNLEHFWADADLRPIREAETSDEVNLVVRFRLCRAEPRNLVIGVPIWDASGQYVTGLATDAADCRVYEEGFDGYCVILRLPQLCLNPNEYLSVVSIHDGSEFYYRGLNETLTVRNYKRSFGLVTLPHEWIVRREPAGAGDPSGVAGPIEAGRLE